LVSQRYEVDWLWVWGVGYPINFKYFAADLNKHLIAVEFRILVVEAVVMVRAVSGASEEGAAAVKAIQEVKFFSWEDQM